MSEVSQQSDAPSSDTPDLPEREQMTRAERIFVRISVVQTILAVTGFMVGVIALFAALNEADAVRKQQMASVWPHVTARDMNYGIAGEERYEVIIGNRGIGPARVANAEVFVDGARVNSWSDIVRPVAGDENFAVSNIRLSNSVLAPGEDIIAFSIDARFTSSPLVKSVQELARSGRVNVVICYCSVFDDCWKMDALSEQTSPVPTCEATDTTNTI